MSNSRERVHPALLHQIDTQDELDGIDLNTVAVGRTVTFETRHSVYKAVKQGDKLWLLNGGTRWEAPAPVYLVGSTWGGSVLKPDWIGEGMHVEIYDKERDKTVTTSVVTNMWEGER